MLVDPSLLALHRIKLAIRRALSDKPLVPVATAVGYPEAHEHLNMSDAPGLPPKLAQLLRIGLVAALARADMPPAAV